MSFESQIPRLSRGRLMAGEISRYRPIGVIAQGDTAQVTLARENEERWVVIKRPRPELLHSREEAAAFLSEVGRIALLAHDNICPITDAGSADDGPYLVSPYFHGETMRAFLSQLEARGRLMRAELAAYIAAAACDALEYAFLHHGPDHKPFSIVHGNLRPQTVLLTYSGAVKLLDVGLESALLYDRRARASSPMQLMHFAPERARGEGPSHAADIFSLGVLLWEAGAGRSLFRGRDVRTTLQLIRECRIQHLREVNVDTPPDFAAIVARALSKEPVERYPTSYELGRDLRRFLAAQGSTLSSSELARLMRESFPDRAQESDPRSRITAAIPTPEAVPLPARLNLDHEDRPVDRLPRPSHPPDEDGAQSLVPSLVPLRAAPLEDEAFEGSEPSANSLRKSLEPPPPPRLSSSALPRGSSISGPPMPRPRTSWSAPAPQQNALSLATPQHGSLPSGGERLALTAGPIAEERALVPVSRPPSAMSRHELDLLEDFQRLDEAVSQQEVSVSRSFEVQPPPPRPESARRAAPKVWWRSLPAGLGAAFMIIALLLIGVAQRTTATKPPVVEALPREKAPDPEPPRPAPREVTEEERAQLQAIAQEPPAPPEPTIEPPPPAPPAPAPAPSAAPKIAEKQAEPELPLPSELPPNATITPEPPSAPLKKPEPEKPTPPPAVPEEDEFDRLEAEGKELLAKAQANLQNGRRAAAEKELKTCIERTDLAECHRDLGILLRDAGNKTAASEQFRRYLSLFPDADDAITVEKWIAELEQ